MATAITANIEGASRLATATTFMARLRDRLTVERAEVEAWELIDDDDYRTDFPTAA